MAIVVSAIAGQYLGTDASSFDTLTHDPVDGCLELLFVGHSTATSTPLAPTVTGLSLTWTQEIGLNWRTAQTVNHRVSCFTALGTGGTGGHITMDWGSETITSICYSLIEVSGIDTADPIVQSVSNNGGTTTMTASLSAFTDPVSNACIAAWHHRQNTSATPEAGFTELHDVTGSTPINGIETMFKVGEDTDPTATAGTATEWGGIALQIAVPGSSGSSDTSRAMMLLGVA